MAKKKQSKILPYVIKWLLILMVGGGAIFLAGRFLVEASREVDLFRIQSIVIDPSLQFIGKSDLKDLFGKSIFSVHLKDVQKKLSHRYPQASHLKLVKRFPNQILIVAKKRTPFARVQVRGQAVTLDDDGVVLAIGDKDDVSLPLITGMNADSLDSVPGLPLRGADLQTALKLIKLVSQDKGLSGYPVQSVDISNTSKIFFTLPDNLQVFIDRDSLAHNVKVLGVVLSRSEFQVQETKYIDLRFKEPIIGKK